MSRSPAQIEKSLADRINQRDPNADTIKGPIVDVTIIPTAAELARLEARQDNIALRYSWEYIKTQDYDSIILYGSNYGLRPSKGAPSTVRAVAYSYTRPQVDIPIPAGKVVSSADNSISYRVASDIVMFASRADSYYNAAKRRYQIPCMLVSIGTGHDFEVMPGTIRNLRENIPGIDGIENIEKSTPAKPEESILDFGRRTQAKFNGLEMASASGFRQILMNHAPSLVRDVIPIFSSDVYFQRRTRRAAWDLYIRGERIEDTTTDILSNGHSSFLLPMTPVTSVSNVLVNGLPVAFTFQKDEAPETRGSVLAQDRILLGFAPPPGAIITVQYQWNSLISGLNEYISKTREEAYRTSILVRECQPVLLRVRANIQPSTVFDTTEVLSRARANAYTFFDSAQRREILSPQTFATYLQTSTAGVRKAIIQEFTRAITGDETIEDIELAPFEYAMVDSDNLSLERL